MPTLTRPDTDQIKFSSSKSGVHNLDTYLEEAEVGNLRLGQLLANLANPDGSAKTVEFRANAGFLEYRPQGTLTWTQVFDFNVVVADAVNTTGALSTSGGQMTGPIRQANGTPAAPSYSFSAATGTGFYLDGTDLVLAVAGNIVARFSQSGVASVGVVGTSGNQSISGVKTFLSLPLLPADPTTALQPATKQYVDARASVPDFLLIAQGVA